MATLKRKLGKKVAPSNGIAIRAKAQEFRDAIGQRQPYVKVTALLEALQEVGFMDFEVVEDHVLGEEEAVSYPDQGFMRIKRSIYDRAHAGDGHCRFTIAHELGHLWMHQGQASYARGTTGEHKVYEDSEWQADTFASEFLIDQRLLPHGSTEYWISTTFGVSHSAANNRLRKFKQGK
ncbi:ImmA/IrrE family metallo-endopeptidase [Motiliproteus sp.]|uniref:ImmA/IrrE family metallo-endopeptidase n=1 Tax=Motiliproteus sp. TaxID=1898955 RepID=UPI003BAA0D02